MYYIELQMLRFFFPSSFLVEMVIVAVCVASFVVSSLLLEEEPKRFEGHAEIAKYLLHIAATLTLTLCWLLFHFVTQ